MKPLLHLFMSMCSGRVATQFANEIEPRLRLNRDSYLAGPQTPTKQLAALHYFDVQWAAFQSSDQCGADALGDAGRRCLSDRSRDGTWPWELYYRDPIVTVAPH
jgi:hypothetical protein